jgi:hypothetical protein
VRGLVFLGFPLHRRKAPATERAEHLRALALPLLFVQGTRDELAEIGLVRELAASLGARATLREVEGGDHSFALRRSAGRSEAEVHAELAAAIAAWMRPLSSPSP